MHPRCRAPINPAPASRSPNPRALGYGPSNAHGSASGMARHDRQSAASNIPSIPRPSLADQSGSRCGSPDRAARHAHSNLGQPRRWLRPQALPPQSAVSPASPTRPWLNLSTDGLRSMIVDLHAYAAKQVVWSPWGAPLPGSPKPFADSHPQRMHPAKFPASLGLHPGILLAPAAGAVLMSASTIIVAINAQLLRRVEL
jgi:hypothetical protein